MKNLFFYSLLFPTLLLGSACSKKDASTDPPAKSSAPARETLVKEGELAPDFEATAHNGEKIQLSALRGKKIVLYFYPKDDTPGCTTEAQGFRDEHQAFTDSGTLVLGVSTDDNESHRAFADKHGLPFLLLPDSERSIARAYGVGSTFGMSSRMTILIDAQGKIARVYSSVDPNQHANEILKDLESL